MQEDPALSQAVEPLNVSVKGIDPKPKGFCSGLLGPPRGWSKLALNGALLGLRLPKRDSKRQKGTNEL